MDRHKESFPSPYRKTQNLSIPTPMGPNVPGLDVTIALAESLPPSDAIELSQPGRFKHWFEHLEGSADVLLETADGRPAIMGGAHLRYLAGWPDDPTFDLIMTGLCADAGLETLDLPDGLRVRDTETHRFVFNYTNTTQVWKDHTLAPAGVHWEPLE